MGVCGNQWRQRVYHVYATRTPRRVGSVVMSSFTIRGEGDQGHVLHTPRRDPYIYSPYHM